MHKDSNNQIDSRFKESNNLSGCGAYRWWPLPNLVCPVKLMESCHVIDKWPQMERHPISWTTRSRFNVPLLSTSNYSRRSTSIWQHQTPINTSLAFSPFKSKWIVIISCTILNQSINQLKLFFCIICTLFKNIDQNQNELWSTVICMAAWWRTCNATLQSHDW